MDYLMFKDLNDKISKLEKDIKNITIGKEYLSKKVVILEDCLSALIIKMYGDEGYNFINEKLSKPNIKNNDDLFKTKMIIEEYN